MTISNYDGILRPEITLFDGGVRIDWVTETREVIWSETCEPKDGNAFASQIECRGQFEIKPGYFIDSNGNRHFVLQADAGQLGAAIF